MRKLGLEPDPWQAEVLEGGHPRLLLNCCRQSGKSTVFALLALCEALYISFTWVLLVSRSMRQSRELFRRITNFYARLNWPMKRCQTVEDLELTNQSRIVSLPCKEELAQVSAQSESGSPSTLLLFRNVFFTCSNSENDIPILIPKFHGRHCFVKELTRSFSLLLVLVDFFRHGLDLR
jgi:hypothetical protein